MPAKFDTLYICDWLPPDFGAVGQYSLIAARNLASEGRRIVLAGLSTNGDEETETACEPGHLKIIKFRARPYKKSNFQTRILWTIKTNTKLVFRLWRELQTCDEIMFTGSPPLLLHWLAPLNLLLRKRLVYRITDFHPECLIAARGRSSWWLSLIYRVTLFWRRQVTIFEVLGEDQKTRLLEIGIDPERIRVKSDPSPVLIDGTTKPLAWPKRRAGQLLLLYSGNWGVAHDHHTFLHAYRYHHQQGSGRVLLWLNAVGTATTSIEKFLREEGLPYRRTYPVALDELASLLATPDAHLITLSDAFVGFVLPSKVHGCIASNKPILYVGSERSEVHRFCLESNAYYERIPVGDIATCSGALERLADHIYPSRVTQKEPAASSR